MNKLFKFALAALPMLMLASCAKDDLESEAPKAEKSETRYLRVTLSSPSASPVSRAGADAAGWSDDNTNGTTSVVGDKGFYADGTEEENKIRTLEFYFYDSDKQFHSYVPMTADITNPPVTPTDNPRPSDVTEEDGTVLPGRPNIAAFYHCNVPIELVQGKTLPNYVICIVNSVEGTVYQGSTMHDAQIKILNDLYAAENDANKDGTGAKKYFGMSNSVYYGTDPVTGEEDVLIMAAPFTTDKLLTQTEADQLEKQAETGGENQNEIEKFTINIPVERYAAKVKLDLSSLTTEGNMPDYPVGNSGKPVTTTDEEGKTTTTYEPVALKFTPKRWSANATERTFYFLKSFRTSATTGTNPTGVGDRYATQTELDNILFEGWNNETHKRCFWARTPGYYRDKYPLTSDDIKDATDALPKDEKGNPIYEKDQNGNNIYPFDLWYRNWEECAEVGSLSTEYAEYVMETTMKKTRLTGEGMPDQYLPTASLPSVILLGQYKAGDAPEGTDFYLYGTAPGGTPIVYSGEDANEQVPGTKKIKEQMILDQTIILYHDDEADKYKTINSSTTLEDAGKGNAATLIVQHPSDEVRGAASSVEAIEGGKLHIAADIAVLQFTKAPTNLHFFNPAMGSYQPITAENLNYVNLLLFQNLGGAHFYKDGMAYFTAPIQHWGWYRELNENVGYKTITNPDGTTTTTNELKTWVDWDWTKMKTGDFGVVRNHVYTMKIGSIKGLGTAISDEDDPIVPPADKVKYAVHFHVNIQRWAVLPTQEWNW